MSMKNPLTLAGIEPATFRFVAQHLNHCATAVPRCKVIRFESPGPEVTDEAQTGYVVPCTVVYCTLVCLTLIITRMFFIFKETSLFNDAVRC